MGSGSGNPVSIMAIYIRRAALSTQWPSHAIILEFVQIPT